MFEAFFSAFLLLAGFVLVLCLAYWATRLLGSRFDPGQRSRAIELLDRMPIGADRALCIVKAADKTLLIGITAHSMQTLAELDGEKLPKPAGEQTANFAESLKSLMRQRSPGSHEGREARRHED